MKRIRTWCTLGSVLVAVAGLVVLGAAVVRAADTAPAAETPAAAEVKALVNRDAICYAIALSVGASCLAAGYAVAKVGTAALGAAAEKPELMGRALIFVGLAEGIAIYGLIIGILLLLKM